MVKKIPALLFAALLIVTALQGCMNLEPPLSLDDLLTRAEANDASSYGPLVTFMGAGKTQDERGAAYLALLKAGPAAGVEILAGCASPDPVIREHSLAIAANIKLGGAFEAAVKSAEDPSFKRPHAAAWALGELGDKRAIPHLVTLLKKDGLEITGKEATRSLARFGKAAVAAMVDAFPAMPLAHKRFVIRALGELRDPDAKGILVAALNDEATREDAAWALGTMGRIGDPVELARYLDDPDWRVRVEVSRAVGLLKDIEGRKVLEKLRMEDPVKAVREWAARGSSLVDGNPVPYKTFSGELEYPDSLYH